MQRGATSGTTCNEDEECCNLRGSVAMGRGSVKNVSNFAPIGERRNIRENVATGLERGTTFWKKPHPSGKCCNGAGECCHLLKVSNRGCPFGKTLQRDWDVLRPSAKRYTPRGNVTTELESVATFWKLHRGCRCGVAHLSGKRCNGAGEW